MTRLATRRDPAPPDFTIRNLISYRIHRLANFLARGAALRYRHGYDVSLWEWRVLALLGAFAPMGLKELVRQSGLDKGQASRTVSGLVERGLVLRSVGPESGREVRLRLSAAGRRSYAGLMGMARERDDALRACLSEADFAVVDRALAILTTAARRQAEDAAELPKRRG